MANFIEELFYGQIDPQRRGYTKDNHVTKVSGSINELEEKLTERLQGENKDLFLNFCNTYGELMGEAELDSFIVGFRLGAKMLFDVFCSDDAPLENFLKD